MCIQNQSKNRESQSGRSMLELLLVVVIMALLAISGLYGYRNTIKQYEADRTYETMLVEISSTLNRGSGRTNKGIADMHGNSGYTYDGKAYAVKVECPRNAFIVKVADVDIDLCKKLLKKNWKKPVEPIAFFRSERWGDLCENDSSTITQEGYFIKSEEDCDRVDLGMFAVVVPKGINAQAIQTCSNNGDCYACQRCDSERQICIDDCPDGQICLKSGECSF